MSTKLFSAGVGGALLLAGNPPPMSRAPARAESDADKGAAAAHLFVKRDKAEKLEPSSTSVSRIMLTADQTNGRYSIIDEMFKPGMKTPPHKHAYHSETFMVIAGKMKWIVAARPTPSGRATWFTSAGHVAHGRGGRR